MQNGRKKNTQERNFCNSKYVFSEKKEMGSEGYSSSFKKIKIMLNFLDFKKKSEQCLTFWIKVIASSNYKICEILEF